MGKFKSTVVLYPANSDIVYFGKNSTTAQNNERDLYLTRYVLRAGKYSSAAPKGHYILDAWSLDRETVSELSPLEDVSVTERPSTVAFWSGRVWLSGVRDDEYIGKVLFSQILESDLNIGKCYQANDPTDEYEPDLLDTDGGVINIPDVGFVTKLLPFQESLLVFSSNGVWSIQGEGGFTATSYNQRRISNVEVTSADSIVEAESSVLYWGDSGIYEIKPDNLTGYLVAENITLDTIQQKYIDISSLGKLQVIGRYDLVNKRVYWFYNQDGTWEVPGEGITQDTFPTKFYDGFYYDIDRKSFIPVILGDIGSDGVLSSTTFAHSMEMTDSQGEGIEACTVKAGSFDVVVSTDDVIINERTNAAISQELVFLLYNGKTGNWGWGSFYDTDYYDYTDFGNQPQTYPAYLTLGYIIADDISLRKTSVWVTTAFERIEVDYTVTGGVGSWDIEGAATIQPLWDWASTRSGAATKKKGNALSVYHPEDFTFFTGTDGNKIYTGEETVVRARYKIPGMGRTLQLRISSASGKAMKFLGYQIDLELQDVP